MWHLDFNPFWLVAAGRTFSGDLVSFIFQYNYIIFAYRSNWFKTNLTIVAQDGLPVYLPISLFFMRTSFILCAARHFLWVRQNQKCPHSRLFSWLLDIYSSKWHRTLLYSTRRVLIWLFEKIIVMSLVLATYIFFFFFFVFYGYNTSFIAGPLVFDHTNWAVRPQKMAWGDCTLLWKGAY